MNDATTAGGAAGIGAGATAVAIEGKPGDGEGDHTKGAAGADPQPPAPPPPAPPPPQDAQGGAVEDAYSTPRISGETYARAISNAFADLRAFVAYAMKDLTLSGVTLEAGRKAGESCKEVERQGNELFAR